MNGSDDFDSVMLGDRLSFTAASSVAKQGVVLRLYRVIDNNKRYFAEGRFNAGGTASVDYTVPATDSSWIGMQTIYAEYYGNANFGSKLFAFEIGLKLFAPEYVNSSSEVGKINVRWANVSNVEKYYVYRSTDVQNIVNDGNLIAEMIYQIFGQGSFSAAGSPGNPDHQDIAHEFKASFAGLHCSK